MKYKFTVVSGKWCAACSVLKASLTDANIEYDVIDVDTQEGMDYCAKHHISGLPATVITDVEGNVIRKVVGLQPISVFKGYVNG